MTLTFYLLTLKVVSESCVTWATSVPILVFLGLSVLDLGPMYATDVKQKHRLMPPPYGGEGTTISTLHGTIYIVFKCTLCTACYVQAGIVG